MGRTPSVWGSRLTGAVLVAVALGCVWTAPCEVLRPVSALFVLGAGVAGLWLHRLWSHGRHQNEQFQRTQEELARVQQVLEQRVRERTEELAAANARLAEANGSLAAQIDERRRSEEMQRILAAVLEQSSEAVAVLNADGTFRYVNPAFERMTGYSKVETRGHTPIQLRGAPLSSEERAFYARAKTLLVTGEPCSGTVRSARRDGEPIEAHVAVSPVHDEGGGIVCFAATMRDVTRVNELEAELHQAQKMDAIGRLAGGVAHDFNNLLSVILTCCDLALADLAPDNPARGDVEEIRRTTTRASTLTHQLLAFGRRQMLQPEVLDLNAVVAEMEKMLRRLIREDITLVHEPEPELWSVQADPSQLQQVLLNLVINARDAMDKGGRITLRTANRTLGRRDPEVGPELRPGDYVSLSVDDTGCGMDRETMERLFEPFFSTKPKGMGTGLGLATVYGIVKQSNGHIRVRSAPGEGASFTVLLPRVAGSPRLRVARKPVARPVPLFKRCTVLVVEDEEAVRKQACRALEKFNLEPLEASDPAAALERFRQLGRPIDLLVTDVVLPGMTGPALARMLQQMQPDLEVLFISGYGADAIERGWGPAGRRFLAKPFGCEALAQRVQELLRRTA